MKKIYLPLLTAGMVLSLGQLTFSQEIEEKSSSIPVETVFSDLKNEDWYTEYIQIAYDAGMVNGKSSTIFDPTGTLTFGEFAVMLTKRYYGTELTDFKVLYGNDSYWGTYYVEALREVFGDFWEEGNIFTSKLTNYESLSRYHASELLGMLLLSQNIPVESQEYYKNLTTEFYDISTDVSTFLMGITYDFGLMSGFSESKFAGERTLTRGEACVILSKLLEIEGLNEDQYDPERVSSIEPPEVLVEPDLPITGRITADFLNIRNYPGVSGDIVGKFLTDDEVELTALHENGWYQITFLGANAYISASFVEVSQENKEKLPIIFDGIWAYITNHPVYVFSSPDESSEVIEVIEDPRLISITEKLGDWYKVGEGYVHKWSVDVISKADYWGVNAEFNKPSEIFSGAELGKQIAEYATHFVGYPYKTNGNTTDGFDCIGLAQYVYGVFGIELEHSLFSQYLAGEFVEREDLMPGDLLIIGTISHVGIYVGDNYFVHASTPTSGVIWGDLSHSYYDDNLHSIKRLV